MDENIIDNAITQWDLPPNVHVFHFAWAIPVTIGAFEQEVVLMCASHVVAETLRSEVETQFAHGEAITIVEVPVITLVERYAGGLFWDTNSEVHPTSFAKRPDLNIESDLPAEPFALFTWGGGIDRGRDEHLEGEYVVHQAEDESVWVLFFEELEAAEKVSQEYALSTGARAEVRRTRAVSLDTNQNVRFYSADGRWTDLSREDYIKRLS